MLKSLEDTIIWGMLFALVIPFICFLFIDYFEKGAMRPAESEGGMKVLRVHKSVYYFGLSIFLFFLSAMCFLILLEQGINLNWLFIFPIVIGAIIIQQSIGHQVSFNDEIICYRNSVGTTLEYKIKDLEFVEFNEYAGWHVYKTPDGKLLRFSTVLVGVHELIKRLR